MRGRVAVLRGIVVLAVVFMLTPASQAGWGHRHCRYGYGYGGYPWGYGIGGVSFSVGYGRPYLGYGCYSPYYSGYGIGGYGYGLYPPYGVRYRPADNYVDYFLPPLYEPAELTYGPLAVKQFLGLDRNFALGPLREPPLRLPLVPEVAMGEALAADELRKAAELARRDSSDHPLPRISKRPEVRISSAAMKARARDHVVAGDELFRIQKFHSALQKYKLAGRAAPDMAEAFWRQGHALVATGNYDLAATAFRRALALDGDIARGGFQLDDIYGKGRMAKTVHLENLAELALAQEDAVDPYFLLGVFLAYDGQRERAESFFDRALDLAGPSGGYVAAFLEAANPSIAEAPPPAPRPARPAAERAAPTPIGVGTDI